MGPESWYCGCGCVGVCVGGGGGVTWGFTEPAIPAPQRGPVPGGARSRQRDVNVYKWSDTNQKSQRFSVEEGVTPGCRRKVPNTGRNKCFDLGHTHTQVYHKATPDRDLYEFHTAHRGDPGSGEQVPKRYLRGSYGPLGGGGGGGKTGKENDSPDVVDEQLPRPLDLLQLAQQ